MLTVDLVRARARKGKLHPQWIDVEDPENVKSAELLCSIFESHQGATREALDEALADLVGDSTHFQVVRGLARLLDNRCTWETCSPLNPVELRRLIFERAAAHHPVRLEPDALHHMTREQLLAEVAAELEVDVEAIEEGLYADLRANQRMTGLRTLAPLALLHRYNVSLVQTLLLRADELRVEVGTDRPGRLRQLYRWLKFHQLMHRSESAGAGRWRLIVDGPTSLFQQSQRYGMQLANFLPAVLLLDDYHIEATVEWGTRRRPMTLELTPKAGLVSHLRERGTWVSAEQKLLEARLRERKGPWRVGRDVDLIDLGGRDMLVPDLVLEHEDGRRALVDIVGFWRRAYLERRLDLLAAHGPPNLICCISRRMNTEKASLQAAAVPMVEFAEVISLPRVLKLADEVAR